MLRLLTCASAVCVLAAGAGVAVAFREQAPPKKVAALERLASVATTDSSTEPAAVPSSAPHPIAARMLRSGAPIPVPPSILQPRNGWLVSDGRTLVAVYAGAAGDDPSTGRLVVVRQNLVLGRQRIRTIDARAMGALAITAAPLGSSVETSAQTGRIHLQAAGGRALHLDLDSGAVGNG